MKKVISLLVTLVLALSLPLAAFAADYPTAEGGATEIQKYGNIVLDIASTALTDNGYEYGDVLDITVDGKSYDVPFCTNYSDVDTGKLVLRDNKGTLILAINMGDFTSTNGIAVKNTADDGSVTWTVSDGRTLADIKVSIGMKEKGGYKDEYLIHQLTRTNERADYATDQIFANFRNIASGKLGKNMLFRSSSPVNNEIGRAAYADDFEEANHINAVLNLADTNEDIDGYFKAEGFDSPYYQMLFDAHKVKALGLGVDFTADDFKVKLADGLRFFAANEGPYLVHCTEGKDRAGFVSALLACLMGASYDEIVADYMATYENYYKIEKGSAQYEAVKNSNIVSILTTISGVEKGTDLSKIDLKAAALSYLKGIGLTDAECDTLQANLAKDYAAAPVEVPVETPAAPAETPDAPVAPAETPAETTEKPYVVAEGDSLWKIAEKAYGNGRAWSKIYNANKEIIKVPGNIYAGQKLIIPAA